MRRARGFTLIEMVVVIAVMGVLMTILFGISRTLITQQRYATTRARMANIETALAVFVSTNKRLPCPADGRTASSTAGAGTEAQGGTPRTCTNDQQYGVVPWATLGLTAADAEDGWAQRFTYRVGPDLVKDSAMDFSSCDPAGTGAINTSGSVPPWCIAAGPSSTQCNTATVTAGPLNVPPSYCTPPSTALTTTAAPYAKGILVTNVAGPASSSNILMDPRGAGLTGPSTGAAYVVVSHGPEGGGGYNAEGVFVQATVTAGTAEQKNFANIAWVTPALAGTPGVYMVDDSVNATDTTSHFDDILSRIGILALAVKAQLGPRTH